MEGFQTFLTTGVLTGNRGCNNLEFLISSKDFQIFFRTRTLDSVSVWLWFTVFTQRLSPQSGFGHPTIAVNQKKKKKNLGSRHQRLLRDHSSQEHEITLWQIELAWQDTMSLIRSCSVLNQIAYKCPKLNQATPWNVAAWLCWSFTQAGQHVPVLSKSGGFCIAFIHTALKEWHWYYITVQYVRLICCLDIVAEDNSPSRFYAAAGQKKFLT